MVKRFPALALLLAAVLAALSYPAAAQVTFDYNPPALGSSEAVKRNDLDAELDGINGAKQAVDADLTCLAGLTSAADKLAYFTGSGTCAVTDFSVFARTLVDDADAATARTTLGLVIGTNVQAFDADLSTWAGVTPSANGQSLVSAADYATMRTLLSLVPGTNVQAFDSDLSTWATLTPSANAQSLVTAADYAAMRTLLSLVPGTNVQAFDADLTTWAGVTPSANGQSLVAAANYAAMRALLDLEAGTDFYAIAAADAAFLSASEIDTGSEIAAIVSGETGTGELVFDTSPTIKGTPVIGDGAGNDKLSFAAESSDPACSAGNYFIWANSTGAKLKKCQDGVVSDLAPAGGGGGLADAYDRMTDGTTTATASSNDIFKFRGANGIAVTVQSNDVTHGDNVLIDGSGAGDVDGPASAADNAITRYDGTSGKIVQDSPVKISDQGELDLPLVATPGTPATDRLYLFAGSNGGRMLPRAIGPTGLGYTLQPFMGTNKIAYWNPPGNATTVPGVFGMNAPTAAGTATARNVASTNMITRTRRLGYVSAASAANFAGHYAPAAGIQWTIGDGAGLGGFYYNTRFIISDAAAVTGARMFVGMRNASAAPTNVEYNTLTNAVGVCDLSTSANLHICYGGSVAQTAIDLGANFPDTHGSANLYELALFAPANNQVIYYQVTRLNTGDTASGTLSGTVGTVIPNATTFLGNAAFRGTNATALAVGLDIVGTYIETDN